MCVVVSQLNCTALRVRAMARVGRRILRRACLKVPLTEVAARTSRRCCWTRAPFASIHYYTKSNRNLH